MHYFSGKGCSEFLESMHYCIGILTQAEYTYDVFKISSAYTLFYFLDFYKP